MCRFENCAKISGIRAWKEVHSGVRVPPTRPDCPFSENCATATKRLPRWRTQRTEP
jgi:hypothetical protein